MGEGLLGWSFVHILGVCPHRYQKPYPLQKESILGPGTQSLGQWGRVERPVIAQSCTAASGHLGPSPPLLAPPWQDQPFYWRTLAIWPRRFGRLQQRSFLQWVLEIQSMFCFAAESVLPCSTFILHERLIFSTVVLLEGIFIGIKSWGQQTAPTAVAMHSKYLR